VSDKAFQKLIIISGPSGVGKTTVLKRLLKRCQLPLRLSVSATTRPPRPNEIDGVSYHFISDEEFQTRRKNNEFLECMEVFGRGHWYGTLKEPVYTSLNQGKWVILEIDVQGAERVWEQHPEAISIFIHPGSAAELERRLRKRGTESETALNRRLEVAKHELDASEKYKHVVINQTVEQTVNDICRILRQEERLQNVR
jgi:guanylate kinase